jgi:hypothetical protein
MDIEFYQFVGTTDPFDLPGGHYLLSYRTATPASLLLEHLEQRLPVMRWTAIRTVNATRIEGTNVPATLDSGSFRFNNTGPAHADVGLIDASSAALQTPYNTPTDRAVTPAAPAVILQRPS